MKQQVQYLLAGVAVAAVILVASTPLRASETDERIESSFKKSYVSRVYLKDDAVNIESKNGVVTLTGSAKNAAEKSLVTKLVEDVHGVTGVKNEMTVEEAKTK